MMMMVVISMLLLLMASIAKSSMPRIGSAMLVMDEPPSIVKPSTNAWTHTHVSLPSIWQSLRFELVSRESLVDR